MRLLITLIFIGGAVHAQSVYNSQSVIAIASSSVVVITDTVINRGTIINNGDLRVGGAWINQSQYEAGVGKITFSSDGLQVINHNDQSFSKLTISGGGQKLFLAHITIEDALDLSEGILVSENNAAIIFSPHATVSGGSDDAHIQGPVYHQGPGDKLFPLGNGTAYLPVELLDLQGPAPEVGIRLVETAGAMLPVAPSLQAVSKNRYWHIDVVSGSLDKALVSLPIRDEAIITGGESVVVAESPSLTQPFESLGNSDLRGTVSNGMVTSDKFVSQPYIAIGTTATSIIVYNAVSPNGDGLNDFLRIGNIENFPENKFTLFNRWGDKVFEIENYDNKERVFKGRSNLSGDAELVNGTYFYTIETKKDGKRKDGFLTIKD